jgi:hypothetical protein
MLYCTMICEKIQGIQGKIGILIFLLLLKFPRCECQRIFEPGQSVLPSEIPPSILEYAFGSNVSVSDAKTL